MAIFISPHNDDETLFGAFTLLRTNPLVVVVYDSYLQEQRGNPVTWQQRRAETVAACEILGVGAIFLGLSDADPGVTAGVIRDKLRGALGDFNEAVFAPAIEPGGHEQHNLVAAAVEDRRTVCRYLTYERHAGKSTAGHAVPILTPRWIGKKLRALACYESQWDPKLGCYPHFLREQTEYYAT